MTSCFANNCFNHSTAAPQLFLSALKFNRAFQFWAWLKSVPFPGYDGKEILLKLLHVFPRTSSYEKNTSLQKNSHAYSKANQKVALKSDFLRSCSLYGFSLIKGSSSSVSANSILRRSGNFFPKNSFSLVVFLSRANFFRVRFVKFDAFAVAISLRFSNLCVPLINQTNGIVGDTRLSVPIQIQKPIVQT